MVDKDIYRSLHLIVMHDRVRYTLTTMIIMLIISLITLNLVKMWKQKGNNTKKKILNLIVTTCLMETITLKKEADMNMKVLLFRVEIIFNIYLMIHLVLIFFLKMMKFRWQYSHRLWWFIHWTIAFNWFRWNSLSNRRYDQIWKFVRIKCY